MRISTGLFIMLKLLSTKLVVNKILKKYYGVLWILFVNTGDVYCGQSCVVLQNSKGGVSGSLVCFVVFVILIDFVCMLLCIEFCLCFYKVELL